MKHKYTIAFPVDLNFRYVPAFASHIKNNLINDFVSEQIRLSFELKIPLLKYLSHLTSEQLHALSIETSTRLLEFLEQNQAKEQIEESVSSFMNNSMPQLKRGEVQAEDITLLNFVRKKVFLQFIPGYTSDIQLAYSLIDELERFVVASQTISFNAYTSLVRSELNDQIDFIEKIAYTSPSIIYVFDLVENKMVYSNDKVEDILGYRTNELQELGTNFIAALEHPDDIEKIYAHFNRYNANAGKDTFTLQHRIKHKEGHYLWMNNYERVFKRDDNGKPTQIIGMAVDINDLMSTSQQLKQREEQLLNAQELAEMGSFEFNLETKDGMVTPQLLKILELKESNDLLRFSENIHPNDRPMVQALTGKATEERGVYDYECRYLTPTREKYIWAKGNVSVVNGALTVKGTIMDVTERHNLIERLQYSDAMFREAQAITHIGNWTWDVEKDRVEWSDEMYRIYGFEPQSFTLTFQQFMSFLHPADKQKRVAILKGSLETGSDTEYTFRIICADKTVKILHSKTEVKKGPGGRYTKLFGTCQDVTEKQLLIERLQESERLFKQAQSISHLGNWSLDLDKKEIQWSDEMFAIYGIPMEERKLTYHELYSYNLQEDKDIVNEAMEKSLETGSHDFFYRIRNGNGNIKIIHSKGEVLYDDNRRPYKMVGTAQDVTQQKLVEKELLENKNFIQKIADAAPSIITSYNVHTGKYNFVNEGFKKLLGYETNELLSGGTAFINPLIHPDDLPVLSAKSNEALISANLPRHKEDNEIIIEYRYRIKHRNGQWKWLQTFVTVFDRNEKGLIENLLNISVDITDNIEAGDRLREQERFINHIAEASPTILYLFDLVDKRFIYINREVKEVLGYEPEEIIALGDKVSGMYLHPEDEIKSAENYVRPQSASNHVAMRQFEGRVKHKNNKWVWILTREVVFKRDERGRPLQVLGSALDITLRREMEQSLVYKTHQLQQSNSSLEEFAHVASHDLQEPLRKISTFGDRLLTTQSEHLTQEGQVYLEKIVLSTRRMQQLINDILSVSIISGDRSFELCALDSLLDEVLQTLEFKIEEKKAVIKSDPLPRANVNPSQIRQLFQNLLSNSLKFSKPGVAPLIRITHEYMNHSAEAKYKVQSAARYHKIIFRDNGIGFEDIFAEKIFNIFQRLNGRTDFEGTGIGLAICRKIAENHGGYISAKGVLGEGAEFTIILPVA